MSEENKTMKTGTTRPPYDEAFKRAAVAQWMSGVPAKRVAEGLGITAESLRVWRRRQEGTPAPAADGGKKASTLAIMPSAQELQAEVRRLRAQLQSVTNQRDILKKTVGIFAGPNGSVSP